MTELSGKGDMSQFSNMDLLAMMDEVVARPPRIHYGLHVVLSETGEAGARAWCATANPMDSTCGIPGTWPQAVGYGATYQEAYQYRQQQIVVLRAAAAEEEFPRFGLDTLYPPE